MFTELSFRLKLHIRIFPLVNLSLYIYNDIALSLLSKPIKKILSRVLYPSLSVWYSIWSSIVVVWFHHIFISTLLDACQLSKIWIAQFCNLGTLTLCLIDGINVFRNTQKILNVLYNVFESHNIKMKMYSN